MFLGASSFIFDLKLLNQADKITVTFEKGRFKELYHPDFFERCGKWVSMIFSHALF